MNTTKHLRRIRWAVRATLAAGVAASVAANILHADDNPISQTIAAWPPLALLLTVELISRVPVHKRHLAILRLFATAAISGIAAWVSYWHMVGVAARYGETGASPYLLPISVDGLIVVASICLVELAGRIRLAEDAGIMSTASTSSSGQSTKDKGASASPAANRYPSTDGAEISGERQTSTNGATLQPTRPGPRLIGTLPPAALTRRTDPSEAAR